MRAGGNRLVLDMSPEPSFGTAKNGVIMSRRKALQVTRDEDFSQWFQEVISAAEMGEQSGVRGCMIILPWGYAIWERVQRRLDDMIRATGHDNCHFPIFIPLELIEKEASHVEGFAKEMAVVTHHRLVKNEDGKLVPDGKLESPLVVRPTSEAMITNAFKRWIQSYRDLPVKINQWANVVRWEMRTRMFLRTSEFLWQEGHTAHASADEADSETRMMLECYRKLAEEFMAIPVICGEKSEGERFPGAVETHTIEAMMQDGRALQAGTSHNLGQNFAMASEIRYIDRDGVLKTPYTTSWGASTRLIGALIMVHGDDDGLRLPPRLAPQQVVILPLLRDAVRSKEITAACHALAARAGVGIDPVLPRTGYPGRHQPPDAGTPCRGAGRLPRQAPADRIRCCRLSRDHAVSRLHRCPVPDRVARRNGQPRGSPDLHYPLRAGAGTI
jgi:prolyl-tRNA synthetase